MSLRVKCVLSNERFMLRFTNCALLWLHKNLLEIQDNIFPTKNVLTIGYYNAISAYDKNII